jgi:hypothetical protein
VPLRLCAEVLHECNIPKDKNLKPSNKPTTPSAQKKFTFYLELVEDLGLETKFKSFCADRGLFLNA